MCRDDGDEYNFSAGGNTPVVEFTRQDKSPRVLRMCVNTPFCKSNEGERSECSNAMLIKVAGPDSVDIDNEAFYHYRYRLECERRSPPPGKSASRGEIEYLHKDWDVGDQVYCHGTMVMSAMLPIITASG
ncbi:hypothetical protein GGR57DRAFT_510484 [Xylariaceae sp. FL1272]|nr:hypothetical protein GGR57DRAFT_510484 [Xylariaceae sp. FL1272]